MVILFHSVVNVGAILLLRHGILADDLVFQIIAGLLISLNSKAV